MVDVLEKRLADAYQLLDSGAAIQAELAFLELAGTWPASTEAWKMHAALAGERGAVSDALDSVVHAIEADQGDPESYLLYSRLLHANNECSAALRAAITATELGPDVAEIWLNLGVLQGESGQYEASAVSLRRSRELAPDLDEASSALVAVEAELGHFDAALLILGDIPETDASSVDGLLAVVKALRRKGQFDPAIELLEARLESNPAPPVYTAYLLSLIQAGFVQEAIARAQDYLERRAMDHSAPVVLGKELIEAGKPLEAVELLAALGDQCVDSCERRMCMGQAYEALNDYPNALCAYRDATQLAPAQASAFLALAIRLVDSGDHQDGVDAFLRAIEINPLLVEARLGLGSHYIENSRYEEALPHLEAVLSTRVDNAAALALRARARIGLGQKVEGFSDYERSIHIDNKDIDVLHNYALALHIEGDTARALGVIHDYEAENLPCTGLTGLKVSLLAHTKSLEASRILDYPALLLEGTLTPPEGFDTAESFCAALAHAVLEHPTLSDAPEAHATRNGSHTGNLFIGQVDVFSKLEQQVKHWFERYIDKLVVDPDHPLKKMMPVGALHTVAWAVVMRRQGHQVPHIHPGAWLSGVCYLRLPEVMANSGGNQGWLQFGDAPDYYQCDTSLVSHLIKPELGKIVLFPSYAFHRTIPFDAEDARISLAFDVMPVRGA